MSYSKPAWWLVGKEDAIRALLFHDVIMRNEAEKFLRRQGYNDDEAKDIVTDWTDAMSINERR